MKKIVFYKQLILAICTSFAAVASINFFFLQDDEWIISLSAILLFSVLSIIVFLFAKKASTSSNKYLFIRIIVINVFVKIFLSFALFFAVFQLSKPSSRFFIIPFLMVYLIFTFFETNVLMQQSKSKGNS